MTCRRNAFIMLSASATPIAVSYLQEHYGDVAGWDENFQLSVIELIRKDCQDNLVEKVSNPVGT